MWGGEKSEDESVGVIINRYSKMCGQEIKVYPFLNSDFIRKSFVPLRRGEGREGLEDRDRGKEELGPGDGSV